MRAAFGGHLPTLDLVAGRTYNKIGADYDLEGEKFSNVDSKFNDRNIGLQFTLPIFSGGFTQSKVRQSEYRWHGRQGGGGRELARHRTRRHATRYLGVISGIARVQALLQALELERRPRSRRPRPATRWAPAPRSTC